MISFIVGFFIGAVSVCTAAWLFISWAIAGGSKSVDEDMVYKENDNI